jgi:hypothetical protein
MSIKRGGITVGVDNMGRGIERPWNMRPGLFDNTANAFVGRAALTLQALEGVAAPFHNMNRAIVEKSGPLPPADVRLQNARQAQRQFAQARAEISKIASDLAKWSYQNLRVFDYSKLPAQVPAQSLAGRQELRAVLRSMSAAERLAAIRADESFLLAALEQPAAASGLAQTDFDLLVEIELERRVPEHLATAKDAADALEEVRRAEAATEQAIANELRALAQPEIEGAVPKFASTFPQRAGEHAHDDKANGHTALDEFNEAVAQLERERGAGMVVQAGGVAAD